MTTLPQEDFSVNEVLIAKQSSTVDLLDILLVLAQRSRLIVSATFAGLLAGVALTLILKPDFTATAVILPPQQQSSTASLLNQLGTLASLGGGSSSLGLKNPADMYVGILKSRTIADDLITRFKLKNVYKQKKLQDTRKALKSHTNIEVGKDSLIQISVTDHDAILASDLANAYVELLYNMNSRLAITEAAQRRVFFDQQLDSEKKALVIAEDDLRAMQQKTGLIQLNGQAQMIISSITQLRAQISSREVMLQSLKTFSTDQNPDVIRMQEEIGTMRSQLAKLEDDQHRQVQPGDIAIPAGNIPEQSLEYLRKYREVRYHETLFELLSKQYEAARIDEAKSASIIQVVDHAIPPDRKSGPSRLLILAATPFLAFLGVCFYVLVLRGLASMRDTPGSAEKLSQMRNALRENSTGRLPTR